MKCFCVFVFFALIQLQCFSQSPVLQGQSIGSPGAIEKILQATSGDYLALGLKSIDNQGCCPTPKAISLKKFDDAGSLIWENIYNIDSNGGYYSCGDIVETDDGGYAIFASNSLGGFFKKLDSFGNQIIEIPITLNGDYAVKIKKSNDGGFFLLSDGTIFKLSLSGVIEWQNSSFNIGNLRFSGMTVLSNGDIVTVGNQNLSQNGFSQAWVVRINSDGVVLNELYFGGLYHDSGRSIVSSPDGGFIIAGSAGIPTGGSYYEQQNDYWVLKFDSQTNFEWERKYGGTGNDNANDINLTSDGGYIVTGLSTSINGDAVFTSTNARSWSIKIDSSGNLQWQISLASSGSCHTRSIIQSSNGDFFLGGAYSNSNNGNYSYQWIAKIVLSLSNSENEKNGFALFPNPTDNVFTIKTSDIANLDTFVTVYDFSGNIVLKSVLDNDLKNINIQDFSSGIYFVEVIDKDNKVLFSDKIIKK